MILAPRRIPRWTGWSLGGSILLLSFAAPAAVTGAHDLGTSDVVPVRVELGEREVDLERLNDLGIDLDGVFDGWARIYAGPKELEELERLGFAVSLLPNEGKIGLERLREEGVALGAPEGSVPSQYHTYDTLTADLQTIAADHPSLTRLTSIGQSVQGRELWMMKIAAEPDVESDIPAVAYIAAMHGDEVVGKEMCFNLINDLTDNYGTDPRVTELVDGTEIWIMPSMNPDGTDLGQRYNANGVNLNRDFPDLFMDPNNTPEGRAIETAHVMSWTDSHAVNLSANFHGGALVANYPFDNNETGSSVFSPTPDPDQDAFVSISRTYADNNPPMYANNTPPFDHGVTNGAEWYAITGGMQDWNYGWYGNFQVTLEVSNIKWPPGSELPQFWEENRESMLSYLERVHEGVRGVVTDAETGAPLAATARIDSNPYPSYTDPEVGDYHRLVLPGSYTLQVSAPGYATEVIPVTVSAGPAVRCDAALQPLATDLQPSDSRVEDGPGGDGWLDPGETADLAVTLNNLGRAATQVSARLEPTGWYASVTRADATFPDISTAQSAESNPPHFEVFVDPAMPEGHKPGFALRWTTADSSGTSEPFFLDAGGPWCHSADATDLPQPIVDNETTTSQLQFTTDLTITDVRVPVDIGHSYIGDLVVELTSPSATAVALHDRTGGSANDIVGTYGADLTPAEPLTTLLGEPGLGTWQLTVTDFASADTGTLNGWGVELCEEPVEASTPEMRFRDLFVDPGGVRLEWWSYPGLTSYRVYRSTDPSSAGGFVDVTSEDGDDTDTLFLDASPATLLFYIVTGVGPQGEGPKGHFGE